MKNSIRIDLNHLLGVYFEEDVRTINEYTANNESANVISRLIEALADNEFYFYTIEELFSGDVYRTPFYKMSQAQFTSLKNQGVFSKELQFAEHMYINFEYVDGMFSNEALGKDYLKENIPGLFQFNNNIITYYFLRESDSLLLDPNASY